MIMETYNGMKLEQMGEKWIAPGLGVKVRDDQWRGQTWECGD